MELTDGNVLIRPPLESDVSAIVAAVHSSIDELSRWFPWASADYDDRSALAWINKEIDPTGIEFAILDSDDKFVGSCGLNKVDKTNEWANLGYWVRSDSTGNGYATSAVKLLAGHAFSTIGLNRVEVMMQTDNAPSRAVAERAGGTYEGVRRECLKVGGSYHDCHVYSILASD